MKSLVVLGAGESGVGAALLGKSKGYKVFVSDGSKIADQFRQELIDASIDFEEEGHTIENIKGADVLIKSPGIPDDVALIKELVAFGLDPISEIEFAFQYNSTKIIAITGSNGKTTTTALIHHLIEGSNIESKIGGNYGISFARLLLGEDTPDIFVLEISSFQLDGIRTFRPDVSLILNITPDHLDRYEYKMELYAASKFRIALNQRQPDLLILNQDQQICNEGNHKMLTERKGDIPFIRQVSPGRAISTIGNFSQTEFVEIENPVLQSVHNLYNAQCAILAAEYAGVPLDHIRKRLESFEGMEHRMEIVRKKDGVLFINDTKATNVDATLQALRSMDDRVIWIVGGTDKGNEYDQLAPLVKTLVKGMICLGIDNENIKAAFEGIVPHIEETKDVNQAVQSAFRLAEGGGVVLLSPACASFDLFKNYIDRGNQFKAAVQAL